MNRNKVLIPVIVLTVIIITTIIILNVSDKYDKVIVDANKWNSIKEERIENTNLQLMEIAFNEYKLIVDEKNSTVYYSVVNGSKNKYNPNVNYSTNSKNVKLVFLSDEITDEKVKEGYVFKLMIYDENEYHIYNLKCTQLPIISINYNKENITNKSIPMEMYLFDNITNIPNRITISSGKIKLNDDGYIFSLHMLTPGKNKRENSRSILNMKPNSEYVLTNVDLQNDEFEGNIVELFLNNQYMGKYYLNYLEKTKKAKNMTNNFTEVVE